MPKPKHVRNFWIDAEMIEGTPTTRPRRIATGPRSKLGGFMLDIYQRSDGDAVHALRIYGIANKDGSLTITATADSRVTLGASSPTRIDTKTIR